jgi:hypothetical protein
LGDRNKFAAEIDEFVDDALTELEEIRIAAKKALGQRDAR